MGIIEEAVFAGREALITGGTGGIGRAIALGLAARGAGVILQGGASEERLRSALEAVRAAGGRGTGFLERGDVSGAAERIFERAGEMSRGPADIPWGPDILVCAWGPFKRAPLEETSGSDWEFLVRSNLVFPGTLVSLSIQSMKKKKWGRILLFGGTNTDTIRGYSTAAAYSAAKTALGSLVKSAALSAAGRDITCNALCPGLTDTEYLDEAARAYNRERSAPGNPLKPEDIARVALRILENPQVNGAIIPVDCGIRV